MSIQMKAAHEVAKAYNQTILASDPRLDGVVAVHHEDGSTFSLTHAFVRKYVDPSFEPWILVFTEHQGFFVFAEDDLTWWQQREVIKPVETLES